MPLPLRSSTLNSQQDQWPVHHCSILHQTGPIPALSLSSAVSESDIIISTLLPIASIALKLGSQLLSGSAKTQPAQEERLAPTVQSLFQRLGVNDANSEQNRPAINHFMSELLQTLGQENNGQSLPEAIDAARSQLANGTQSTRLDALQSELDTLKGSLGSSELNLDQLLGAFKQTLPNGKGEGLRPIKNGNLRLPFLSGRTP